MYNTCSTKSLGIIPTARLGADDEKGHSPAVVEEYSIHEDNRVTNSLTGSWDDPCFPPLPFSGEIVSKRLGHHMIAIVEFGEDFRFSSFCRQQIKGHRHNRPGIVVRDARRT